MISEGQPLRKLLLVTEQRRYDDIIRIHLGNTGCEDVQQASRMLDKALFGRHPVQIPTS
jgi:hypothetical protein